MEISRKNNNINQKSGNGNPPQYPPAQQVHSTAFLWVFNAMIQEMAKHGAPVVLPFSYASILWGGIRCIARGAVVLTRLICLPLHFNLFEFQSLKSCFCFPRIEILNLPPTILLHFLTFSHIYCTVIHHDGFYITINQRWQFHQQVVCDVTIWGTALHGFNGYEAK